MTNAELYAIISRIPLDNEDRGKLYQYLADLGNGNTEKVEEILKLIPSEASEANQLADKAFVESQIDADAGSYISKDAEGTPFDSYQELISYTGSVNGNDFALVRQADAVGNVMLIPYRASDTSGSIVWTKKYKDFVFYNNLLTNEQKEAINSGVTSEWKAIIGSYIDNLSKIIPDSASSENKLVTEEEVDDFVEEAKDSEVEELLNS